MNIAEIDRMLHLQEMFFTSTVVTCIPRYHISV
uniref:Uncharacterized protein n=1 Tax=Arundo donax TaxID=35708 RepID=A0A0A9DGN6_ARUDO